MPEYLLSSPDEAERLRVQARLWEPEVERLLDEIGLPRGASCLDLGCGAMGVLGPLSRRVGREGRVVGVDRDPLLLAAARDYLAQEALANVEVLDRDAFDTGLPSASFDVVHVRFLMVFGGAERLLGEMMRLVRPGGTVCIQETDQSSWNFYPERPVWPRLKGVLEAAFVHVGGDANLGRRTVVMAREAGLSEVRLRAAVLGLQDRHPYLRMPILGAQRLRPVIVSAGLMSESELDDTLAEMEAFVADPTTYAVSFTVMQVWGRRPLGS